MRQLPATIIAIIKPLAHSKRQLYERIENSTSQKIKLANYNFKGWIGTLSQAKGETEIQAFAF